VWYIQDRNCTRYLLPPKYSRKILQNKDFQSVAGVGEGGISGRDTSECPPEDFRDVEPGCGHFHCLSEGGVAAVLGSVRLEYVLEGVEEIFHAFSNVLGAFSASCSFR
jgi:hypothetical protein